MATLKTTGPAFISASVANIYNPPGNETVRNIHIANEGASAATFSLWYGATGASAAGTALHKNVTIAAGAVVDYPFPLKLTSSVFLTGQASAANTLTATITTQLEAA